MSVYLTQKEELYLITLHCNANDFKRVHESLKTG